MLLFEYKPSKEEYYSIVYEDNMCKLEYKEETATGQHVEWFSRIANSATKLIKKGADPKNIYFEFKLKDGQVSSINVDEHKHKDITDMIILENGSVIKKTDAGWNEVPQSVELEQLIKRMKELT